MIESRKRRMETSYMTLSRIVFNLNIEVKRISKLNQKRYLLGI